MTVDPSEALSPPLTPTQAAPLRQPTPVARGSLQAAVRRLLRDRSALVGLIILTLLALAAVAAPALAPYSPIQPHYESALRGPGREFLLGTDGLGRDYLSRVIYGARVSLAIGVLTALMSGLIGAALGVTAGYFGGRVDAIISRLIDVMLAFPFIVLVIAIVAIVGPGTKGVLIGVPLVGWALYARLARSEMLVLREQPFMLATTALGYTRRRAILRHAVPNLMRPCLIYSTLDMVVNLLLLASLAYLGLGAQPPAAEWGVLIADGKNFMSTAWWISIFPGIAIIVTGLGFSLMGDGLAELLRPKAG
jgi:peptide/nickel transport system permease protein